MNSCMYQVVMINLHYNVSNFLQQFLGFYLPLLLSNVIYYLLSSFLFNLFLQQINIVRNYLVFLKLIYYFSFSLNHQYLTTNQILFFQLNIIGHHTKFILFFQCLQNFINLHLKNRISFLLLKPQYFNYFHFRFLLYYQISYSFFFLLINLNNLFFELFSLIKYFK